MSQHALLAPSSSSRWLKCTPSARWEDALQPAEEEINEAAAEGTFAHALAEYALKSIFYGNEADHVEFMSVHGGSPFYSSELQEYVDEYVQFVKLEYAKIDLISEVNILLEFTLNLAPDVPESFGMVDIGISSYDMLHIIDFKYGKGVFVSAVDNSQLKLYAYGVYEKLRTSESLSTSLKTIKTTIYQPRLNNIQTIEYTVEELLKWIDEYVKPRALLAFDGKGEFVPGDHCKFCCARHQCKAFHDHNLQLAVTDFSTSPTMISDKEVVEILNRGANLVAWIKGVQEYALSTALKGKVWPGYKVVTGRSQRAYKNEAQVLDKLVENRYNPVAVTDTKLLGLTELTKLLGKKKFNELVGPFLIKSKGKPTLVPETDSRNQLNSIESAIEDFAPE